ncbi:tRNA wybutosine-synthesizing protein 4 [Nibea albiflora]|uniref:tRNA wybutosine-synthesizing protein 4 n=1 Tax=Nibea albiflora TaxID=240163 RepID=A0ACB7EGI1_NIBAL|nr:tRNA wybutosine-synthesizing protein 4 [Nibea albiflora]
MQVQGTNDSSVVSKVSAAAKGYFQDVFLQHFVCKVARRAPLINRGYYVRWRAVDHCVRRFLHITENCPKRQARFDSLYFRLHAHEALDRTVVFEVDFPDVARRKAALINSNITLRGMIDSSLPSLPGPLYVSSSQYHLLGVDVREESQVEEALGAAGLDWAAPTLILSEVVLTYMETQCAFHLPIVESHSPECANSTSLYGGAGDGYLLGVRLYHTLTSLPSGGVVVYGGRSSPLNPIRSLFRVTLEPGSSEGGQDTLKLCVEEMVCTGDAPPARWRHTAAVVSHNGKDFLFVFGGKNETEPALGDGYFLCQDQQHWTELSVEGAAPDARHSHSACSYQGGLVLFGGVDKRGVPLGDTVVLRPNVRGFSWERIKVQPPPVPRYSHSAHVIGEKLVVVGGVWLHSDGVPGALIINLSTHSSVEFSLDTTLVPWPLMLHSFCSELTDPEEPELLLIGGGGNCFSFGTHFNLQPVSVDLRPVLG